jgi:nucleoside-diphosphate-sugar epimerase
MKIWQNEKYLCDVKSVSQFDLPWEKLRGKSVLISGATGAIGSFLVDVIMAKNAEGLGCKIFALGRNEKKSAERFGYAEKNPLFVFLKCDVSKNFPREMDSAGEINFALHLASNTHPVLYATDPVGTIQANVFGTQNVFEFARNHNVSRCLFASSVEIYGENRGDVEKFSEKNMGYIDSNTLRAGYSESKRCGESLCQAFIQQKKMDIVIARLARTIGATVSADDSRASSQFINNAAQKKNVVLKSAGNQIFSYTYVSDAALGLLLVLLKGECGEAYNVAWDGGEISLKNLAQVAADFAGVKVVFENPSQTESAGYSRATRAILDGTKIYALGYRQKYDAKNAVLRTLKILSELAKEK